MSKRRKAPPRPVAPPPRGLPRAAVLTALSCLHTLLFVVFAVLLGQRHRRAIGPLGAPEHPAAVTPPADGPPALGAWLFVAFTLALWIGWALLLRKDDARLRRFIAMMLAPGTLMALYLLYAVCL